MPKGAGGVKRGSRSRKKKRIHSNVDKQVKLRAVKVPAETLRTGRGPITSGKLPASTNISKSYYERAAGKRFTS